ENQYQSAFILNPRLSGIEFVKEIVHQLSGVSPADSRMDLFHQLHKIFFDNHSAGKHSVIVIDEAQAIQEKDIFEELRLLLNFQLDNAFLLTIVLIGQPELRNIVGEMQQLVQRMAVKYHLKALNENETREYIQHRLKVSGAKVPIFNEDCYRDIYLSSSGIPRRINTICDLALLVGFGGSLKSIDNSTIAKARDEGEDMNSPVKFAS
ncbi:MAG: AAA family ATPase, partial [Candidatus Omnitrophica bacterium]|nr:AAA family ATPase [Candidatus Omnitrophota bacterium]